MSVCVMIPTYRRPRSLDALLRALAPQSANVAGAEILILDNDAAASAREIVARHASQSLVPMHYRCVQAPGLSSVRNAGLEFARGRFRFLAMIDDDELPEPQWLEQLLLASLRTRAAAVIGPVPARLPDDAPRWVRRGRFFDLPTFPDAATLADGYTGNCLIDLDAVAVRELHFDSALNMAGGEDQLFFRELIARGGRITYAARASAEELVGHDRANAAYLVRRSFRRGNTLWLCERRLHGKKSPVLLRRLAVALARISAGAALLLPRAVVRGRSGLVTSLCDVARGAGMLAGAFGVTYLEYRRSVPEASRT